MTFDVCNWLLTFSIEFTQSTWFTTTKSIGKILQKNSWKFFQLTFSLQLNLVNCTWSGPRYVLDSRMLKTMRDEFKSFPTLLTRQQTSSKVGLIFKKCWLLKKKFIFLMSWHNMEFTLWISVFWKIKVRKSQVWGFFLDHPVILHRKTFHKNDI